MFILNFIFQLASLGLNIVLISRNPTKLQRVADELSTLILNYPENIQ